MNDKNTTTLKDTYGAAYNNYKKGDLKAAEILCYKILSIDPNFIESKINSRFSSGIPIIQFAHDVYFLSATISKALS